MDFNKLLELLLNMSENEKEISTGRFAAFLITILLAVVLWHLPELITAIALLAIAVYKAPELLAILRECQ